MDCYMMRYGASEFNLPTVITDTFNRANGNLGNADTGQSWLTGGVATTAWVVNTNTARRATATTSVNDVAYIDCGKSDVIVSADITYTTLSSASRVIARMSGTNINNCMAARFTAGNIVVLERIIGGAIDSIAQATVSITSGSTHSLVLKCRGNIFSVYVDGVLKISTEDDNALKTNTIVGMFLACSSTSSDWFDNFSVKG